MIIPAAVLVALSAYLLQGDVWTFWTWYLLALVLGVAAMPLTGRLFRRFDDKGWIFSKVTAIAITGFLTWFLVTVKILKFTAVTCVAVTVICTVLSILLYRKEQKDGFECIPFAHLNLVYAEELLIFAFFIMWTYFGGFHSAAYGTEKIMGSRPGAHICGKTSPIWSNLADAGLFSFSIDNCEDLEFAKREVGDRMRFAGNVPPIEVMKDGSIDDVIEACKDCLRKCGDNPKGYILNTGCQLPIGTPKRNVEAFIYAARKYGRGAQLGKLPKGILED